jgi:DNA-binding Xre family transcriptional regulator
MKHNKKLKTKITFRLGEVLAEKQRGVRDVARETGIGVATISRIVNNRTHGISINVLERLCDELGIVPSDIYETVKE